MDVIYSFTLDYRSPGAKHNSSVGACSYHEETAREELLNYVNYYAAMGDYKIQGMKIEKYCPTCNGSGEVYIRYKRQPGGKHKTCPDCKGKGLPVIILEL